MAQTVLREYVLQRDKNICQWPGCGRKENVDVLFILETGHDENVEGFQNGITLCRVHMDTVNLHEKTFGPLMYDLIRLVEFEQNLHDTEQTIKSILSR
ncbi:MAG: hypothetical protein NTV54_16880 [Ignavibacteriales bacterium]|nr:hypothetical protein [Ignavibacteriales bacterium]